MTRDELIADIFKEWPDARVFVCRNDVLVTRTDEQGRVYFEGTTGAWINYEGAHTIESLTNMPCCTEVPRPTPLPDPAGDLPDGTRVRAVVEGVTQGWARGGGRILGDNGRVRAWTSIDQAEVEVLTLPAPLILAPLAATPGTRWRDPETGTEWVTRDLDGGADLVQIAGEQRFGGLLYDSTPGDQPIIARLVPIPKYETVSTVEELDALPEGSIIRGVLHAYEKYRRGWCTPNTGMVWDSSGLAGATWTVLWRSEG